MTKGMNDPWDTYRISHAITAYPTKKAMIVARIVGPHDAFLSSPIFSASYTPDTSTAGIASRKA